MKIHTRKLRLIIIFSFLCLNVAAQANKETYISSDGGFKIDLPAKPDTEETLEDAKAYNLGLGKDLSWGEKPVKYIVQYIKLDTFENPLTAKRKAEIMADMIKRVRFSLIEGKASVSEKNIVLSGNAGKELEGVLPTGKLIVRTYLIGEKLYQLYAAVYDINFVADAVKTLDSFKLLDKREIVAQKLKETVVEPLPQTPIVAKLKSDAADENLKGKVKTIFEETRKNLKSPREPSEEKYFDERGNMVREISYVNGYPFTVTAWGYLDGNRVSREKSVDYNGDEYELLGIITGLVVGDAPAQQPSAQPNPVDERYDYKYRYRYDTEGNPAEEWMYFSSGKLWLRYVYTFKAGQKETGTYDEGGLNMRAVETLDKNGDVVEYNNYDDKGKLLDTLSYTYERDGRGNWIVQKSFTKKKVKGKSVLTPNSINYRTIAYYD
jgi:hypothetical protein